MVENWTEIVYDIRKKEIESYKHGQRLTPSLPFVSLRLCQYPACALRPSPSKSSTHYHRSSTLHPSINHTHRLPNPLTLPLLKIPSNKLRILLKRSFISRRIQHNR